MSEHRNEIPRVKMIAIANSIMVQVQISGRGGGNDDEKVNLG
jgi:hypothetical protein